MKGGATPMIFNNLEVVVFVSDEKIVITDYHRANKTALVSGQWIAVSLTGEEDAFERPIVTPI
jgi:hypothetical protein